MKEMTLVLGLEPNKRNIEKMEELKNGNKKMLVVFTGDEEAIRDVLNIRSFSKIILLEKNLVSLIPSSTLLSKSIVVSE